MKLCKGCKEEKELSAFPTNRHWRCKSCMALYMREYYIRKPEKAMANRSKQVLRDAGRDRFTRHKITIGQYDDMVAKFNGKCWSCKDREAIVIDHNHNCCKGNYSCGKCVRGVLCSQCNTALGLLQDSLIKINSLSLYLRQTS